MESKTGGATKCQSDEFDGRELRNLGLKKTSLNLNLERSELRVVCLSLWHRKTRNSQTWKRHLEKSKRELGLGLGLV